MNVTIPIPFLIFLVGAIASGVVARYLTKPDRTRGDDSSFGNAFAGALALAFFMSGLTVTLIIICIYLSW